MNTLNKLISLTALAGFLFTSTQTSATAIILENSAYVRAVSDRNGGLTDLYTRTDIPVNETDDLTHHGMNGSFARNINTIEYEGSLENQNLAFVTSFEHILNNLVDDSKSDYAESFGRLRFSIDSDVSYNIGGFYSLFGEASRMLFSVALESLSGETLLSDFSESIYTADEKLIAGVNDDGDQQNRNAGNLSGMLSAGTYVFSYRAALSTTSEFDRTLYVANSAKGCVGLILGAGANGLNCGSAANIPELPEPHTWMLMLLGIVGFSTNYLRKCNA